MAHHARFWSRHVEDVSPKRGERFKRMAELTVPADKDYLPLVRTSAMQVGALLELPLPQVTDLRLAVDEACASFMIAAPGRQLEPAASSGATLCLSYERDPDYLRVTVAGPAPAMWPTQNELGWEMLRAVVGDVQAEVADGVGTLTMIEPLPHVF